MTVPANDLSEELEHYRTRCFWWVARTVRICDLSRDTLVRGLRTYGGWEGMRPNHPVIR